MHKAPLEERLDFYRYRSAQHFFLQAVQTLEYIQKLDRKASPRFMFYSLWVAFYALYGKPFKQQRPKGMKIGIRLSEEVVPHKFALIHKSLIESRDKMFAHTDLRDFTDDLSNTLNALLITVVPGGYASTNAFIEPMPEVAVSMHSLLQRLIKTCEYRGDKIWRRWTKHLALPVTSTWSVNVGTASDAVLEKSVYS